MYLSINPLSIYLSTLHLSIYQPFIYLSIYLNYCHEIRAQRPFCSVLPPETQDIHMGMRHHLGHLAKTVGTSWAILLSRNGHMAMVSKQLASALALVTVIAFTLLCVQQLNLSYVKEIPLHLWYHHYFKSLRLSSATNIYQPLDP